jgi:hypothetical protein
MKLNDNTLSRFRGNAPLAVNEIQRVKVDVTALPQGYLDFLYRYNGGEGFVGPNAYVIFWRLGELAELNEAYQVAEFAPGLLAFGSNGGG